MRRVTHLPIAHFVFLAAGAFSFSATAQDLTRQAIPRKWIEPLVPEDMPARDLKEYVKSDFLEKARAEQANPQP